MILVVMKVIHIALLFGASLSLGKSASSAAEPTLNERLSISVTNKSGDVFTNLSVAKVLGDGLVLEHKSGQLKVKYEELPQDVREKFRPLAAAAQKKEIQDSEANATLVAV